MNSGKVATGLTLVELIICLAILALLLSLASPSFQRFTNRQIIRHQIWELRRALELARGLAVTQQKIWKVCMATNNHHCIKQGGQRLLVFQDSDNDHRRDTDESLHLDLHNPSTFITSYQIRHTAICSWLVTHLVIKSRYGQSFVLSLDIDTYQTLCGF